MKQLLYFSAALVLLFGCELKEKLESKPEEPAVDSQSDIRDDNSSTSLDWAGTYKGILPCADCEGIETIITIKDNMTYSLKTKYLGKDDMVYEQKGDFLWNEEGNIIILNEKSRTPRQYMVGENYLLQLDLKGNKITGDLADKYYLHKVSK
ncbi:MAG: copper resistance protein NlpE [Ignavibacteria bacterium]|nr:copper resistance protein NlpE [Ignavibacteria bacterium]